MAKKFPVRRVLVVDDEPLIRWSLAQTLTESGFEVIEAGDARSAVQAVSDATEPFAVIVLKSPAAGFARSHIAVPVAASGAAFAGHSDDRIPHAGSQPECP